MGLLILSAQDIRALLPMSACIEVMVAALRDANLPGAINPLRGLVRFPGGDGLLGLMPGISAEAGVAGIKVVSVMPGNHGTPFDSHQGAVLLFETEHGQLLAVADGGEITTLRTAAVSGAATDRLARPDATVLAILGSGVQAASHLEAMLAVRPLREVRVWSRSAEHARRFASLASTRHAIAVQVAPTAEAAVEQADIVCTVTGAREPILRGSALRPGTHVNAVGACFPSAREVDTATVVRSAVFVDRLESAHAEAGDLLIPEAEGAWHRDAICAELGSVFTGSHPGRTSPDQITLFKSLGIALEDIATLHALVQRAEAQGAGTRVAFSAR